MVAQIEIQQDDDHDAQTSEVRVREQGHSALHTDTHAEVKQQELIDLYRSVARTYQHEHNQIEYYKDDEGRNRTEINGEIAYERVEIVIVYLQVMVFLPSFHEILRGVGVYHSFHQIHGSVAVSDAPSIQSVIVEV